jgi:hypothetical protein
MRSTGYLPETVVGLVVFQTGIAVATGVIIAAAVARAYPARVILGVGLVTPLVLEAAASWYWFSEWLGTLCVHVATWPEPPRWVLPLRTAAIVGVSYLLPPVLAGLCSALGGVWWMQNERGRRTKR